MSYSGQRRSLSVPPAEAGPLHSQKNKSLHGNRRSGLKLSFKTQEFRHGVSDV